MKNKQVKKALNYHEEQVQKGAKKAIGIMAKDGFDGVNYNKTFAVNLDGEFAAAPTPVTSESEVGMAKLMGASSTDFPTVSVATTLAMMQHGGLIGIGIENNVYDIQKGMNAKDGRIAKETFTAYQKIEEAHQSIVWGTSDIFNKSNLLGFYTHPHIVRGEFETVAGKTKWADKTPAQIVDDVTSSVRHYFNLNPKLREGAVEIMYYLPIALFDILSLTKMEDNKDKSIMQHLKKFLPENSYNVKFGIANALATKDANFVAIGDFRKSSMSYEIPLTTEGLETDINSMLVRKNFIAESRGLTVEKKYAAVIFEGA